jgi:hypothetical protein
MRTPQKLTHLDQGSATQAELDQLSLLVRHVGRLSYFNLLLTVSCKDCVAAEARGTSYAPRAIKAGSPGTMRLARHSYGWVGWGQQRSPSDVRL